MLHLLVLGPYQAKPNKAFALAHGRPISLLTLSPSSFMISYTRVSRRPESEVDVSDALPGEVRQKLMQWVDGLPWYKRWPIKASIALAGGPDVFFGFFWFLIVLVIFLLVWLGGCSAGIFPKWYCP